MGMTSENKAKFFAQYWGQKYIYSNEWGKYSDKVGSFNQSKHMDNAILILKPISSISDEDAAYIHYGHSASVLKDYFDGDWKRAEKKLESNHVDYLRSKGYALPWMGLSVEQMVEAGWIKLSV